MSVFDACCDIVHPTHSCVYRLETSTKIGQIVGPLSARVHEMFACLPFCTSISDLDACYCVVHPTRGPVYLQRGDAQLNSIHGVLSLSQPPFLRSLEHCI